MVIPMVSVESESVERAVGAGRFALTQASRSASVKGGGSGSTIKMKDQMKGSRSKQPIPKVRYLVSGMAVSWFVDVCCSRVGGNVVPILSTINGEPVQCIVSLHHGSGNISVRNLSPMNLSITNLPMRVIDVVKSGLCDR